MTNTICKRNCNYAHYWDLGLMYCQRCCGLIIDKQHIVECMNAWGKTKEEIKEYMERLDDRMELMNQKDFTLLSFVPLEYDY